MVIEPTLPPKAPSHLTVPTYTTPQWLKDIRSDVEYHSFGVSSTILPEALADGISQD